MKNIVVNKKDVKHKLAYNIFGFFTTLSSISFSTMIWNSIFFERHKWLTRKNLLDFLQSPHHIEYHKYHHCNDINLKLEDGSEITLWINKENKFRKWSYHYKDEERGCLTEGMSLSSKVIDRQITEILNGIKIKIEGLTNESRTK